jgi:sarcosine oxidase
MATEDLEFVVVGGGVLGLSAAWSLAGRGRQAVVCERTTVGHGGAGSKGAARIFRLGYDDPGYVRLALVAQRLWRRLEAESGRTLLTTTGQVTFGADIDVLRRGLTEAGAPHHMMTADEVGARFPVLSVPAGAVFEPESGVIAAAECLAALSQRPGVEVREHTRVLGCMDDGHRVRVVVETHEQARSELRAEAVLVCAGPWTAPLVAALDTGLGPIPTLEQVAYLAPVVGPVEAVPVFVERDRPWFYGLPDAARGLVKVSLHGAGPRRSLADLERPDAFERPDEDLVAELRASARRVLPGLDPDPRSTERCVYDDTPDGDFVIDRVGRIVIGSGTSGHGFKFAPLLGEMLADLATGVPHAGHLGTVDDLGRFRAGRLRAAPPGGGPAVHP